MGDGISLREGWYKPGKNLSSMDIHVAYCQGQVGLGNGDGDYYKNGVKLFYGPEFDANEPVLVTLKAGPGVDQLIESPGFPLESMGDKSYQGDLQSWVLHFMVDLGMKVGLVFHFSVAPDPKEPGGHPRPDDPMIVITPVNNTGGGYEDGDDTGRG
jgi:hypothetical protein